MSELSEYECLKGLQKQGVLNEEGEKLVDDIETKMVIEGKGLDIIKH